MQRKRQTPKAHDVIKWGQTYLKAKFPKTLHVVTSPLVVISPMALCRVNFQKICRGRVLFRLRCHADAPPQLISICAEYDWRVNGVFASECWLDLSFPCVKQEGNSVSFGTPLTLKSFYSTTVPYKISLNGTLATQAKVRLTWTEPLPQRHRFCQTFDYSANHSLGITGPGVCHDWRYRFNCASTNLNGNETSIPHELYAKLECLLVLLLSCKLLVTLLTCR